MYRNIVDIWDTRGTLQCTGKEEVVLIIVLLTVAFRMGL